MAVTKNHVSLTLNSRLIDKINKRRGLIPLSTYIEEILIERLDFDDIEMWEKNSK